VVSPSPSDRSLSQVQMILKSPFTTSMEERQMCYSFLLSWTPHQTCIEWYDAKRVVCMYLQLLHWCIYWAMNHHQPINVPTWGTGLPYGWHTSRKAVWFGGWLQLTNNLTCLPKHGDRDSICSFMRWLVKKATIHWYYKNCQGVVYKNRSIA
jgi:hypothetical protein